MSERLTDDELVEWSQVVAANDIHQVWCDGLLGGNCACQAAVVLEALIDEVQAWRTLIVRKR